MKSVVPVRRSRSGRPNTAGDGDVPVTASMELLPPEAASSPSVSTSFEPTGQDSREVAAMGAPASLQQASSRGPVRRSSSAHQTPRDPVPVVQLTSTRVSVGTNATLQQSQSQLLRGSLARYASIDQGSQSASHRPTSAASSTASSMLVGGVPGPLPTHTPATLSRLWTPEECGSEIDDSANTRAVTASSLASHARAGRVGGPRGGGDAGGGRGAEGASQSGLYPPDAATYNEEDFYRYLESRRPTEDSGVDTHAFTVPDYSVMDSHDFTHRHLQRGQSPGDMRPQPDQGHTAHHSPATGASYAHHPPATGCQDDDTASQPPGTPMSVASGVVGGSGIFFTALRRSLGPGELPGGLYDESSILSARSAAPTEALSLISAANPIQEPSAVPSRAPLSPRDGVGACDSVCEGEGGSDREDPELTDYLTAYDDLNDGSKSVWDNPVQTPRGTTAPVSEEPSRASFMSLLRDLYGNTHTHSETGQHTDTQTTPPDTSHTQTPQAQSVLQSRAQTPLVGTKSESERRSEGVSENEKNSESVRVSVRESEVAQEARREELRAYMAGLQSKLDEEGHKLVELPANYEVLVEQLLMARRAEYASLAGWLGPRKFADLPINNLPDGHEDPKVAEGLARIKAVDTRLAEKEAEAVILARARDPEKWAAIERARLARQAQAVEEALKRERMKRMRNAKMARALTTDPSQVCGEEGEGEGEASVRGSVSAVSTISRKPTGPHNRAFTLLPEEEVLVEQLLTRDDTSIESNPFELSGTACLPPDATHTQDGASLGGHGSSWGSRPGSAWTVADGVPPVLSGVAVGGVLAPLALSPPLGGMQAEGSAAQLLRMAHQVAAGLAAQASGLMSEPSAPRTTTHEGDAASQTPGHPPRDGHGKNDAGVSHSARATEDGAASVDLAAGLAVHTRALLRAQQAAVAGMPLAAIDHHLQRFAMEHSWTADGSLADYTSVRPSVSGTPAVSPPIKVPAPMQSKAAAAAPPAPSVTTVAPSDASTAEGATRPKRDYLREEREAKELAAREADLDKRIRQFKTSDPAGQPLSSDQLAALVAECRAQAERAAVLQAQQAQAQRPQSAKQMLEGTGTPPQGEGSRVLSRQASGSKPLTAQPAQASKAHQPPQQGSVPAAATQQQRPQQQPAGSKPTRASPQSSQSQPATSPLTPTQRAHPHTQGPPVPQQGESRHSSRPATSDTQAPAPVLTLQDTPPKPAKPPSAGRRAGSASAPRAPSLTAESSSTASSAAVSVDSIGLSGAGPVVSGLGSRPSSGGLAKAGRRSSGAITGAATASNP